MANVVK